MVITATQLKSRLGHYLELAAIEDVRISKNGTPVARLTGAAPNRARRMRELSGTLPATVTADEACAIRGEEKRGLS